MNLIVNFTPTGMIPTKEMTPHVPVSINEIVDDMHEALEIGIREMRKLAIQYTGPKSIVIL